MKARSHIIYTDTSHNSAHSVYLNAYQSFLIVALKFKAYIREWRVSPMAKSEFLIRQFYLVVYTAISIADPGKCANPRRDQSSHLFRIHSHSKSSSDQGGHQLGGDMQDAEDLDTMVSIARI